MKNNNKSIKNFLETEINEVDFLMLEKSIMQRVSKIDERNFYIKTVLWSIFALVASFGSITSGVSIYQQFVNSGTKELLSVALSDTSIVLANGTSFFYSLAESLPIGTISVGLAALAALLFALRHLIELHLYKLEQKILWS